MIPSNILQRTFHIRHNGGEGTAFTVEIANLQYIVTAKHVVDGLASNTSVSISEGGRWQPVSIGDVWYSPTGADIALISPKKAISPTHPVTVGNASSYLLSQQIYFLGFPYGLQTLAGQSNNGFPIPFVKTGIIASFTVGQTGSQVIFCDGHNNPGFSGGPIVMVSVNHEVTVIGVVSGYRCSEDKILFNGVDTGLTYRANTGLVIGYGLTEVLARAASSPTGAPVT